MTWFVIDPLKLEAFGDPSQHALVGTHDRRSRHRLDQASTGPYKSHVLSCSAGPMRTSGGAERAAVDEGPEIPISAWSGSDNEVEGAALVNAEVRAS